MTTGTVTFHLLNTSPAEQTTATLVERRRRRAALRRSANAAADRRPYVPKPAPQKQQLAGGDVTNEHTSWSANAHKSDRALWPDSVANPRRTRVR